jgi:hypothetical protein
MSGRFGAGGVDCSRLPTPKLRPEEMRRTVRKERRTFATRERSCRIQANFRENAE